MRYGLALLCVCAAGLVHGQDASITVRVNKPLGTIDPRIFGHFTEETLSSIEGSILSEMLYNRKFEIPEERGKGNFNHVGTANGWAPIALDASITFLHDRRVFYSPSMSQKVSKADVDSRTPAGIEQPGYRYVMPHLTPNQRMDDPFLFRAGKRYLVRAAIRNQDMRGSVTIALGDSWKNPAARCELPFRGGEDWRVYQCTLTPNTDVPQGKFLLWFDRPGTIWVDSVSLIREDLDDGGFRKDALELTRRMKPTSLRWPGGWFVSDYQWKNGIGPIDKRPAELNRAWNGWTTNDVGIDEFLSLCQKLKAEPYICVNVGTGDPVDAAAQVRYAKGRVKDWNIGNEEYLLTLGGTSGGVYGKRYQEFARAMRAVDPSANLVGVGVFDVKPGIITPENPMYKFMRFMIDWNRGALPFLTPMSYYSVHYYEPHTAVAGLSTEEIVRSGLASAENLNVKLDELYRQMREYTPATPHFPLAMDEWAVWMPPKLPPEAGLKPPAGLKSMDEFGLHGTANILRDALAEAPIYNLMQRRPRDFALASRTMLWGYALGIIAIGREQVAAAPSARMLELYSTYDKTLAVETAVNGPAFDAPRKGLWMGAKGAQSLDTSARLSTDGKTLELFIVNRDLKDDIPSEVRIEGRTVQGEIQAQQLNAPTAQEWNSFAEPDRVRIQRVPVPSLRTRFPAHSITKWTMVLQ